MTQKNRKTSGLDIENLMNDIDQQKQLEQTTHESIVEMNQVLDRITEAIGELSDYKIYLMGIIDYIKNAAERIEICTKRHEKAVRELANTIQEIKNVTIKANLDPKQQERLKMQLETHLTRQKQFHESTDRNLRQRLSVFNDEFKRNLDEKGFWCSHKTLVWLASLFFVSVGTIIVEITWWIALHMLR